MQGEHVTEAVKETQAAIDAGNSGQKDLVVQHAQEALTHAEAAEKEHRSPKLEAAIRNLRQAVKQGKSGRVEVAKKAAQAALQKLQAWRGVGTRRRPCASSGARMPFRVPATGIPARAGCTPRPGE